MFYLFFKRVLDILGALLGLVVFSPLFLIVALAIKKSSPGPVLAEHQVRVGRNGKVFRMFKFRSMVQNAHEVLKSNTELYEEYKNNSFKISTDKDPRITKVGKWLRKTSIDELPQLLNVLKGEMSLVGPRAFHTDELEEQQRNFPQTKEFVKKLLQVKPGVTGLWQVSGRSSIYFPERVKIEADYAENLSIFLDLKILLKTLPAVLRGEGS